MPLKNSAWRNALLLAAGKGREPLFPPSQRFANCKVD